MHTPIPTTLSSASSSPVDCCLKSFQLGIAGNRRDSISCLSLKDLVALVRHATPAAGLVAVFDPFHGWEIMIILLHCNHPRHRVILERFGDRLGWNDSFWQSAVGEKTDSLWELAATWGTGPSVENVVGCVQHDAIYREREAVGGSAEYLPSTTSSSFCM